MTISSINITDPLLKRIAAWMKERFPFANALLFFMLYLTSMMVARAHSATEIQLTWLDAIACLVTWSLFLLIRIFDEHKDYALDVMNHPERVLQRGIITLKHLKVMALCAIAVQISFAFILDGYQFSTVSFCWLLVFIYLLLMGVEFFCGAWLEQHLTLYAFSHMLIMPLIVFWLANLAVADISLTLPLLLMMSLAFISGFCFEITRKTRGPEEERATVDSYSKIFGTQGAAYLVIGLIVIMLINQIGLIFSLQLSYFPIYFTLFSLLAMLTLTSLLKFIKQPSLAAREKNETAVAINMLLGYLVIIVGICLEQGVYFGEMSL